FGGAGLPPENVEVIIGAVEVGGVLGIKHHPPPIAPQHLAEIIGFTIGSHDAAVVLGAAAILPAIALRHVDVVEHGCGQALAAIGPVRSAVVAHVHAAVVGIVDAAGFG